MIIGEKEFKALENIADDIKDSNPLYGVVVSLYKMLMEQEKLNKLTEERLDAIMEQMIVFNAKLEMLDGKKTIH